MKSLPYKRADRIKKLLHREVANLISSMKDPRAGNVTITEVELTTDLRNAKVYYTVIDENNLEQTKQMFDSAKGFIRSKVANRLGLKHAIQIEFVFDKFLEQSTRVLFLLDKIKDEKNINQ